MPKTVAKRSPKATKAPSRQKLTEFNPYDKQMYPKHHKIAQLLLSRKTVSYNDIYDSVGEGGASPRTIGYVKAALSKCGIEVESARDVERGTVYRAVPGTKLKLVKAIGTGAPNRKVDDESLPLETGSSARAKSKQTGKAATAKASTATSKAAPTKSPTKTTKKPTKASARKAPAEAASSGSKKPKYAGKKRA